MEALFREFYYHLQAHSIAYLIASATIVSIIIMFEWEGKGVWWLRLPGINLILLVLLLIAGTIEEVYLTFHPDQRTKHIKTSIFQRFF